MVPVSYSYSEDDASTPSIVTLSDTNSIKLLSRVSFIFGLTYGLSALLLIVIVYVNSPSAQTGLSETFVIVNPSTL